MQSKPGRAQLGFNFVDVEVKQEGLIKLRANIELQLLRVNYDEFSFLCNRIITILISGLIAMYVVGRSSLSFGTAANNSMSTVRELCGYCRSLRTRLIVLMSSGSSV